MSAKQEKSRATRFLTVITKLELGGAQQIALNTLRGLDSRQYQRFLIAGQGGLLDEEAKQLPGVEVHLWKVFKHPIQPLFDGITLLRLVCFMRKHRIDIVHTHSSKAGILGRLAAWLAGVPVILHTIHGWPFHSYQAWPVRQFYIWLERLAARVTTRLIAVSAATRRKGEDNKIGKPSQYQIVFPGTDLNAFAPGNKATRQSVRQEFGLAPNTLLVGMVACLKPQKAPLDFICAANTVLKKIPTARFLLVGDGQEREAVETEIHRLGIEKQIILAGWRKDIPRLMQAFDLLVLSSLWEGLPCVLAQAMASGVPVVATNVEGTREAVEDGKTGKLVPPREPENLGQAIIELLRDEATRLSMGRHAEAMASKFELQTMIQKLDTIYQESLTQ